MYCKFPPPRVSINPREPRRHSPYSSQPVGPSSYFFTAFYRPQFSSKRRRINLCNLPRMKPTMYIMFTLDLRLWVNIQRSMFNVSVLFFYLVQTKEISIFPIVAFCVASFIINFFYPFRDNKNVQENKRRWGGVQISLLSTLLILI